MLNVFCDYCLYCVSSSPIICSTKKGRVTAWTWCRSTFKVDTVTVQFPTVFHTASPQRLWGSSRPDSPEGMTFEMIKLLCSSIFFSSCFYRLSTNWDLCMPLWKILINSLPACPSMSHLPSYIIADQFLMLKCGDRYFYDLDGQPVSFTESKDINAPNSHPVPNHFKL